jgi:hypothetical protein
MLAFGEDVYLWEAGIEDLLEEAPWHAVITDVT